jgi:hypothetical protein
VPYTKTSCNTLWSLKGRAALFLRILISLTIGDVQLMHGAYIFITLMAAEYRQSDIYRGTSLYFKIKLAEVMQPIRS